MEQNQFRFKTQEKGLSISCKVLRCFKSLQNRFEIFQLMVDANLEPILNTITNTYLDINRFKYFSKSYSLKPYCMAHTDFENILYLVIKDNLTFRLLKRGRIQIKNHSNIKYL